jgi:hypothetical protein
MQVVVLGLLVLMMIMMMVMMMHNRSLLSHLVRLRSTF